MLKELLEELKKVEVNVRKIDHYEEIVSDNSNLRKENRDLNTENTNLKSSNKFLTEELKKVKSTGMITCTQCKGYGGWEDGHGGGGECDICLGTGNMPLIKKLCGTKKI